MSYQKTNKHPPPFWRMERSVHTASDATLSTCKQGFPSPLSAKRLALISRSLLLSLDYHHYKSDTVTFCQVMIFLTYSTTGYLTVKNKKQWVSVLDISQKIYRKSTATDLSFLIPWCVQLTFILPPLQWAHKKDFFHFLSLSHFYTHTTCACIF